MNERTLQAWISERVPADWFVGPVDVMADRDEVLIIGPVAEPELAEGTEESACQAAMAARIRRFREDTREQRIRLAAEIEAADGRKVAWAVRCGGERETFTSATVPVMTRLRLPERIVLDTLIDAGVARSRSEAMAWCVRLVGRHQADWIAQLREAMAQVEQVRAAGPQ